MAGVGTQKTPDQAAALIQARARGLQQRQRDQRVIRAVTKLQARQRARYTRREFQKLLEFYNEQESFLLESKRRRLRLWHREQELYLLQRTTAEELDAIRTFQFHRSARIIQREWRRLHPTPLEDVDVSGLGRPFDPFGLRDKHLELYHATTSVPPRSIVKKELYGELPTGVTGILDQQKAGRRRAEVHEWLQQGRKERDRETRERGGCQPTRRELYTELVTLRDATAQRLHETHEHYRSRRQARDLDAAQLSASCRNRVAFLLDESRVHLLTASTNRSGKSERLAAETQALAQSASAWSDDRKRSAWAHHTRVLESVLAKDKWFDTFLAGEKRDIRRVYATSPWVNDKRVWQWPPPAAASPPRQSPQSETADTSELTAMDRFQFCLEDRDADNESNNQDDHLQDTRPLPMDEKLASVWWKAHATQSHTSYKRLQQRRLQLLRRTNALASSHSEDAHVTPAMLANPLFYELYRRTLYEARRKEIKLAVDTTVALRQHEIRNQVARVETHIEMNTRRIHEARERVLQQKLRQTKEECAARHIQRIARGKLGRQEAQDHLAQYFVLVRGRAIRKGKCEECGTHAAVLECRECEESLHFCPVCWVQVHATRRRKTHVPIPMVAVVQGGESASNPRGYEPVVPTKQKGRDPHVEFMTKPRSPAAPVMSPPSRPAESVMRSRSRHSLVTTAEVALESNTAGEAATALASDVLGAGVVQNPPKNPKSATRPHHTPFVMPETAAQEASKGGKETKPAAVAAVDGFAALQLPVRTEEAAVCNATSTVVVVETNGAERLDTPDQMPLESESTASSAAAPAKAKEPMATDKAKPKSKAAAQPRMSLRHRMVAEKVPPAQTEECDAADTPQPAPAEQETLQITAPSHADETSVVTTVAADQASSVAVTSPLREHHAARKIQSLHHQHLGRKHEPHANSKPDKQASS